MDRDLHSQQGSGSRRDKSMRNLADLKAKHVSHLDALDSQSRMDLSVVGSDIILQKGFNTK
jgi:hypothetical protein